MSNNSSKPTILSILFFISLLPGALYGQEREISPDQSNEKEKTIYLRKQLDLARDYKEEGDYLWATRLVNYVIDESRDEDLSGESLFELISIGDMVAKRLTSRNKTMGLKPSADSQEVDLWQERFSPINQEDFRLFSNENISIGSDHWGNGYHFDRTQILIRVSESYPDTKWGESAYADLIFGVYGNVDINQAHSFLERYPASEKKPWLYTVLGHAHTDQFKYTSNCDAEYAYGKESMDNAVKYYLLAKAAYLKIDDEEAAQDVSKAAQDLIDGKCPDFLYYLVD